MVVVGYNRGDGSFIRIDLPMSATRADIERALYCAACPQQAPVHYPAFGGGCGGGGCGGGGGGGMMIGGGCFGGCFGGGGFGGGCGGGGCR